MSNSRKTPTRGINWTQVLLDAGIPEPAWGTEQDPDALAPEIRIDESDERQNWMHV